MYRAAGLHMETFHKDIALVAMCVKIIRENTLYKHRRRHLEKNFICSKCSKSFTWAAELKQHQWVHVNTSQIRCLLCNRTFTTQNSMMQHAATHRNKDKFNCEYCDFKTDTGYNVKQHVNGQHGRGVKVRCAQCMK